MAGTRHTAMISVALVAGCALGWCADRTEAQVVGTEDSEIIALSTTDPRVSKVASDGVVDQFEISLDDGSIIEVTAVNPSWCQADLTTDDQLGSDDPLYGVPDGQVGLSDLLFYLNLYGTNSTFADLTTTDAAFGGALYGIPDDVVDFSDLLFFFDRYDAGCVELPLWKNAEKNSINTGASRGFGTATCEFPLYSNTWGCVGFAYVLNIVHFETLTCEPQDVAWSSVAWAEDCIHLPPLSTSVEKISENKFIRPDSPPGCVGDYYSYRTVWKATTTCGIAWKGNGIGSKYTQVLICTSFTKLIEN